MWVWSIVNLWGGHVSVGGVSCGGVNSEFGFSYSIIFFYFSNMLSGFSAPILEKSPDNENMQPHAQEEDTDSNCF